MTNLTTSRLILRRFEENDLTSEYLEWLQDPDVTRYSNQRFRTHTTESCLNYLQSFNNSCNTFMLITHRVDKIAIGTMTVYRCLQHGTADIGLMLGNKSYWRQGLGKEAWTSVMKNVLEENGLRKVTGGAARTNTGMVKIMEQSGMKLEAIREKQELIEGKAVDLLCRFADGLA